MKTQMQRLGNIAVQLCADDSGAEVMEYVLVIGLIIVAVITTIAAFGNKVLARWTSVDAGL